MLFVACEHHDCADQRMIPVEWVVKKTTAHHANCTVQVAVTLLNSSQSDVHVILRCCIGMFQTSDILPNHTEQNDLDPFTQGAFHSKKNNADYILSSCSRRTVHHYDHSKQRPGDSTPKRKLNTSTITTGDRCRLITALKDVHIRHNTIRDCRNRRPTKGHA